VLNNIFEFLGMRNENLDARMEEKETLNCFSRVCEEEARGKKLQQL
jgi:hypothetical protein